MDRQLHTQLNGLCPNASDRVLEKQTQQKLTHDCCAHHREIQVDDLFMSKISDHQNPRFREVLLEKPGLFQLKLS